MHHHSLLILETRSHRLPDSFTCRGQARRASCCIHGQRKGRAQSSQAVAAAGAETRQFGDPPPRFAETIPSAVLSKVLGCVR